ncbi:MAG: MFS transporter [Thermoflexales bacterium]|nr:MFS transporter [Thermoflexales bacterium]
MSTRRIQTVYYLITSLFWLAVGLPMSLSVLLAQARGLSLLQISFVIGVFSLTIVLLEVPTGGLADAMGRKRVSVIAYACILLASLAFLFAFSLPAMLCAFILNGVGRALSSGALDAWFVDSLQAIDPEIDLQPALAKGGTFALLALGGGVMLGSLIPHLFSSLPPDGSTVLTPLSMPVAFGMLVQLALLAATLRLVREERPAGQQPGWQAGVRQVPGIIRTGITLSRSNPVILKLMGASFASGLVLISLEVLWQPHFAGLLGGSAGNTLFLGIVMGGNFIVGMVGNMLSPTLSRLLHKRYGLVCAIFQGVRGALLVGLALQTSPLPAALFFWLVYMNMGITNSPHATLMNAEIPSQQRSSMLSIESFVSYMGSFLGSVGLGYIAERTSIGLAWTIGGAILMVSLGLYLSIDRRQKEVYARENLVPQAG